MNRTPDLNLRTVKNSLPAGGGSVTRVSDFMTSEEQKEIQRNNFFAKSPKARKFDEIDALAGEILARFGWEAYIAWQVGEMDTERMVRLLCAERAREAASRLNLEAVIMAMVGSCVQRQKGQPVPKGVKLAQKIYNDEVKIAKGEK